MRISGAGGRLCVGYQHAARVGAWTLTREGGRYTVTAALHAVDTFWIRQAPMTLRLEMPNRLWVWAHVDYTPHDGGAVFTMTGPPTVL